MKHAKSPEMYIKVLTVPAERELPATADRSAMTMYDQEIVVVIPSAPLLEQCGLSFFNKMQTLGPGWYRVVLVHGVNVSRYGRLGVEWRDVTYEPVEDKADGEALDAAANALQSLL